MTPPQGRTPTSVAEAARFRSTDPDAMLHALQAVQQQNEFMANAIADMQARLPTPEDLAYVQAKRREAENAAWAWAVIKRWAPGVITLCTLVGSLVAYLASHSINISGKP